MLPGRLSPKLMERLTAYYFHHRVIFYLDSYDAKVYISNFLLLNATLSWSVVYDGTTLPENASPAWSKAGGIASEKSWGSILRLRADEDSKKFVRYSRTPSFVNSLGSTVKFRLKIEVAPAKDVWIEDHTWSSSSVNWSDPEWYWSGLFSASWSDPNVSWSDEDFYWGGQMARSCFSGSL